jgi:GT2 family glycosyltransferase
LQDDTVVDEGWLSSLLSVLEAEPTVGLVGSRMAFLDGEAYGDGMLVASDGWVTILDPSPREPASWAVDACFSASCLVRGQAWDSVGGPNPRLFPLWMVDVEFGIRLNEADWSVVMVRDAHARHVTHGSTTTWLRRYLDDRHRRVVTRSHRAYLADRPSGLFAPGQVEAWLPELAARARRRAGAALPTRAALPPAPLEQLTEWARVDERRLRLAMPWFRVRSAVGYRIRVLGRSIRSRAGGTRRSGSCSAGAPGKQPDR